MNQTTAHCSVVTYTRHLLVQGVDIDRRMLDFLCGLDTEFSDMVDGSHLYFPSAVQLEDVILPQDQNKLIVETVENFAAYKKVRKSLGLDKSGVSSHPAIEACAGSVLLCQCKIDTWQGNVPH